ncbi:MAG: calcium/sodium antiporter [Pseudoflavonifractor sp.]
MELAITIFLFALGAICIIKGGDWFVDSASWIAEVTGIPKFIVGATIVSLATTLPELIVSVMAAMEGKVEMAIGNAVGSVTANTGLILAVSIICIPAVVNKKQFNRKAMLLLLACVALMAFTFKGELVMVSSFLVLAIFLLYIADNLYTGRQAADACDRAVYDKKELPRRLLFFVLGTAGIVIGARLLVDNGSALARIVGVPENIIALTFVAIGTSLPELVTTITAIVKKQASLSVGNILGANIIDLTMILPICAFVSGGTLPVGAQTILLDLPVCLLVTVIAMVPTLISGKFRRWQGVLLGVVYAAYLIFMMLA